MEASFGFPNHQYPASLNALTSRQRAQVKGHLVDADNRFNGIFPFFTPLYSKMIKSASNNLTTWLLSHLTPHPQPSSLQM